MDGDLAAIDEKLAACRGFGAEDGFGEFGASSADQTGETNDFAATERETDLAEVAPGGVSRSAEIPNLERHVALPRAARRKQVLQFTTHHSADQFAEVVARHRPFVDRLAVAQHGDAVGNLSELLQAVGDEDDRRPLGLELSDDAEQFVNFPG